MTITVKEKKFDKVYAERFREIRHLLKLSQGSLAELLGFAHRDAIAKIERCTRRPGHLTCVKLIKIAAEKGIDVDIEYLRPDWDIEDE